MNKLIIENDKVVNIELDDSISLDYVNKDIFFNVSTINLNITKDTTLKLYFKADKYSKLNISINVNPDIKFSLFQLKTGEKVKTKYTYELEKNSILEDTRLYSSNGIRELDIVDLNEQGAQITINTTTISTNEEKYDMLINHNAQSTNSYINNHGITKKEGSIIFNITSVVPKGITGCIADQKSRIIEDNNNISKINPILLIDEYDVIANHSAYIGGFNKNEIFYLNSRGINNKLARKLLTNGFIKSMINKYIDDIEVKEVLKKEDLDE